MNTQKKMIEEKKQNIELLVASDSVGPVAKRPLLKVIFGFLFSKKTDFTLEEFEALERKPSGTKIYPAPYRDQYSHIRWHL